MDQPVPKEELLERERRWSRPAGIAAVLGVALAVASVAVQQSAVGGDDDTDAERLINIHEHAGEFLLSNALQGLAFLLFAVPLWFLFKAAQGRTEHARTTFAVLAVIGPVLLFASQVISGIGFTDVAEQFEEELPALEREGRQEARQDAGAEPAGKATGAQREATEAPARTATAEGEGTETEGTGTTETTEDEDEDPEENTPKEDRAEDLAQDSGTIQLGGILSLPGFLGFVIGMVYIPLWAMRTGLLTRFWGSLGMAIGVVVVLLPPAQLVLILWFAALGLMLIGIWPGTRPPAWEAGVAMPWPKPGGPPPEEPGEPPGGDIEGSGREVSEAPLPEESPSPGSPYEGESQGQRRKKRKRRS